MQITLQQSVEIRRPAHEIFAYVSDLNLAKQWRVEVRESSQVPHCPMVEGSAPG